MIFCEKECLYLGHCKRLFDSSLCDHHTTRAEREPKLQFTMQIKFVFDTIKLQTASLFLEIHLCVLLRQVPKKATKGQRLKVNSKKLVKYPAN